jgi:hypothetical protein
MCFIREFSQCGRTLPQCLFIVRSRAKVNRLEESYVSRAAQRPLWVADSTGRRNTFVEHLSWRLVAQGLPRTLVQFSRNGIQAGLRVAGDVQPLGQVLSEQPIGVLVGAALPRALRITEVHLDVRGQREAFMGCQLLAAVPGE